MSFLKSNDFAERQRNAVAARVSIAEKFKVAAQQPVSSEKIAARAELVRAREARNAEREAIKKAAAAERAEAARKANELAAEQRAADAETALRLKRDGKLARLGFRHAWADRHPRTLHLLREEAEAWGRQDQPRLVLEAS